MIIVKYVGVAVTTCLLNLLLLQETKFSYVKFGGLVAINIGLVLLSQGSAKVSCSPIF